VPWSPIRVRIAAVDTLSSSKTQATVDDRPRVEPATIEDLPALIELVTNLFTVSGDFTPDRELQERGLELILEQPSRGRIFVVRNDHQIFGMVNLLCTMLVNYVAEFAKQKHFKRITLLTDRISAESQAFFAKCGFEYSSMIPMRRIID
jgi:hypothetical protein